jgi:hypothetical protein
MSETLNLIIVFWILLISIYNSAGTSKNNVTNIFCKNVIFVFGVKIYALLGSEIRISFRKLNSELQMKGLVFDFILKKLSVFNIWGVPS